MNLRITLALAAVAAAIGSLSGGMRAAEPSQEDVAAMQGTWAIESFTLDGNPIAPEQLNAWRRIVEDNHVTWKDGDQTMVELDIKFDPGREPMTLDSTIATGEAKGQTLLAIYELITDDELRVCFAYPGKPRPTEYSSGPGTGQSLYTAKRVRP